jgi:uncharacterized membrane protein required for colicin V production
MMVIDLIIVDFVLHSHTYQLLIPIVKANFSQMQQMICKNSPHSQNEYSTTLARS